MDQPCKYAVIKKEMEAELWAALDALEKDDIVTVRQCAGRAQSAATPAWQALRRETGEAA